MIRIGVIGCGYWGPNLVRNFDQPPVSKVITVCDHHSDRLAKIQAAHPGVSTTTDHRRVIRDPGIDAVVIATPVSTHFELARGALRAGKHVLVEKPLSESADQAAILVAEAERRGLVLMVGHTFLYSGPVRAIKALIERGELGKLYYYDSVRANLGLLQSDVNVLCDLAVHDLSILDFLFPFRPQAVSATGAGHFAGRPADIAFLTLMFEENFVAHINVSWLAPEKVRRVWLSGSSQMVVYDDLEIAEKVRVMDRGVSMAAVAGGSSRPSPRYRTGETRVASYDPTEALKTEAAHFSHCVETRSTPISNGSSGFRIAQVLEAATQSLAHKGQPVEFTNFRVQP